MRVPRPAGRGRARTIRRPAPDRRGAPARCRPRVRRHEGHVPGRSVEVLLPASRGQPAHRLEQDLVRWPPRGANLTPAKAGAGSPRASTSWTGRGPATRGATVPAEPAASQGTELGANGSTSPRTIGRATARRRGSGPGRGGPWPPRGRGRRAVQARDDLAGIDPVPDRDEPLHPDRGIGRRTAAPSRRPPRAALAWESRRQSATPASPEPG